MADAQGMTQAIPQAAIEAAEAAVQMTTVIRDEAGPEPRSESVGMEPKLGGPILKQPSFDWSATDK